VKLWRVTVNKKTQQKPTALYQKDFVKGKDHNEKN